MKTTPHNNPHNLFLKHTVFLVLNSTLPSARDLSAETQKVQNQLYAGFFLMLSLQIHQYHLLFLIVPHFHAQSRPFGLI